MDLDDISPLKVLLVEDEADLAEELIAELKAHWFEVEHVSSASYAVKAAQNNKYDCLVVDFTLMAGDGGEVIKEIRRNSTNLNFSTPVILASGDLTKDTLLSLKNLVNKVIAKPYSIAELTESVKELCKDHGTIEGSSVLFIEDEKGLAEEIKEELEDEGVKVTHVLSADAAFLHSKQQQYSCMIVDINLAIGTGDEFIERIRLSPSNPNWETPIVVASSQISKPLLKKIHKHVQGAVVKPYSIKDLFEKIRPFITSYKE
ncbi:MAG: hypothetical protein CME70_20065 [Halobacteriovorax sp.]|nr:hypothetical protein [Halobacteriovorax sp.]